MNIFDIRKISYSYNGIQALKDVSFSVMEKESIAVLGCNGSGKSTLLHVLAGLLTPTSGEVVIMDRALNATTLKDREFSMMLRKSFAVMLQNPDAMLFCDSVRNEIAFGPLQFGWDEQRIKNKVNEIADAFNLTDLLERESLTLSFGEKKRLVFAAIMATEPAVLILDEPLSGLDPKTQAWFVELLISEKKAGKTLIVATHDLESVEDYADRVIILGEEHSVLKDGPAEEILEDIPLLLKANLIHEHAHRHGRYAHVHPHAYRHEHKEE